MIPPIYGNKNKPRESSELELLDEVETLYTTTSMHDLLAVTISWTTLCFQTLTGHIKKRHGFYLLHFAFSRLFFISSELEAKEVGKII